MGVSSAPDSSRPAARRERVCLGALVVAWGTQAIVTQSLLLREATVLMYGSEFAWGVVLFAWLLGVALGAAAGTWLAESAIGRRCAVGALIIVPLALSVAACAELWVFRGARAWLGVGPGELLPLPKTALAALLFVSPASALVGMAFPLACSIGCAHQAPAAPHLSFAQVYGLESAGSLIGGAAFSFWAVEHLAPIQTALACGAVTLLASAGLLLVRESLLAPANAEIPSRLSRRPRGADATLAALFALAALGATLLAVFAGDVLNHRLIERRWRNVAPGYELVAETESKYQNLALGRRAGQYTLYCDGHVAADFPDPYTFVPLAHFWLCEHPAPRNVLVLGGGAEGLLAEILRHPVAHVDYVEPDARLIGLVTPLLADADRAALADPRVTVHHADARYYVKTQSDRFDLVIARLPEPTSAQRARFYTDEFLAELRRAMTPRSVLCTTASAAPTELSAAAREYLASFRAALHRHFAHIVIGWGDPAQVLAATAPGLVSTDPDELAARYRARQVDAPLFDPAWFSGATDWLEPDKLARRRADLDRATDVQLSTDLRPAVYVQRLTLWEAQTSSDAARGARIIAWLRSLRLGPVTAALAALCVGVVLATRLWRGQRDGWARGAVTLSVATTGFATLALSIVWLFAFQNLYGYVYQRIGWIVALFMGGLVLGCALAARRASATGGSRPVWRRLILVDLLLALLALAVPRILPALAALQTGPRTLVLVEWTISTGVVLTGLLGGAAFALAGRLQLGFSGRAGAAAGTVIGADHAGACLGALLCGILLVPVFGTAATAGLLGGMKLGSAAVLALTGGRKALTDAANLG
jgi:spermidine synthase